MNFKQLGNSIDLHKWYLMLCHVGVNGTLYYLPMTTEPEPKQFDPELEVYEIGADNDFLLEKIKKFANPEASYDPTCVYEIFEVAGWEYKIFSEGMHSKSYFKSSERTGYFQTVLDIFYEREDSVVFLIDPDVGIDLRASNQCSNPEAYIKIEELMLFREALTAGDVLVCFQRLDHIESTLEDFLSQLKQVFGQWLFLTGYHPHQGSFIFVFDDEKTYRKYIDRTRQQYLPYRHLKNYKDLFIIESRSPKSGFFDGGTDPL